MKEFLKENWGWVLLITVAALFLVFIASTKEKRQVGGIICDHVLIARQTGLRKYVTIIKTDDGYIEEKTGLNLYTTQIGSRVVIEVTRTKNK